jgi:hypothetical protein
MANGEGSDIASVCFATPKCFSRQPHNLFSNFIYHRKNTLFQCSPPESHPTSQHTNLYPTLLSSTSSKTPMCVSKVAVYSCGHAAPPFWAQVVDPRCSGNRYTCPIWKPRTSYIHRQRHCPDGRKIHMVRMSLIMVRMAVGLAYLVWVSGCLDMKLRDSR